MRKELIKTVKHHRFFEKRKEMWYNDLDPLDTGTYSIGYYSTKDGSYIGNRSMVNFLVRKRGIWPQSINNNKETASIGFCFKDNKWYGWSHRAIFGFGIGSTVKRGDSAYIPATVDELYDDAISVKVYPSNNNLQFPSDENPDEKPVIIKQYDGDKYGRVIKHDDHITHETYAVAFKLLDNQPSDDIIAAIKKAIKHKEDSDDDLSYEATIKLLNLPDELKEYNGLYLSTFNDSYGLGEYIKAESDFYDVYPGKGEWTALTFEDAKQMAIDFARSVS